MNKRKLMVLGKKSYRKKIMGLFGSSLIGCWPMDELTGAVAYDVSGNGRNGAYTGVDLANAAGPAKTNTRAPYFDGTNDKVDITSAGLIGAIDVLEGSIFLWMKPFGAAMWTTNTYYTAMNLYASANNRILIIKTDASTGHDLYTSYIAGGTIKAVATDVTPTGWFNPMLTWSKSTDKVVGYYNGAQSGATLTGLGVWAGAITQCKIGVVYDDTLDWKGWLAYAGLLNRPATAAEALALYNLGA